MGGLSIWHILVVVVVVMLLFGKGRLSGTMEDLAHGIKAFKKGMKDEHEHKHDMQPPPAPQAVLPRTDRPVETLEPIRTTETDKTPRE